MAILMRLGPREEPLVGDLVEEYTTGRSRLWFWRQAVAAVVAGAIRRIRLQPVRTVGAMTTGWAVLLLLFGLLGDRAADGLANLVWDWDRQTMGYGTGIWWPFQICAALVSYTGFALSALVVARLHRGNPAMLLAYCRIRDRRPYSQCGNPGSADSPRTTASPYPIRCSIWCRSPCPFTGAPAFCWCR